MKKLRFLLLSFLLSLPLSFTAFAKETDEIKVYVDNVQLSMDQSPEIINNRTMVPMRSVFDALGYEIYWNYTDKTVTATKGTSTIQLTIGSTSAYANGTEYTLDSPAVIENSRTLVPLRYIAESSDCFVEWNSDEKAVYITRNNFTSTKENTSESSDTDPLTLCDSIVEITTNKVQGSGIIIGSDGYIATNFHVLKGAQYVNILFNDGSLYSGNAVIVGYNIPKDIVVLKIDKTNLKPVTFRNSDTVAENESVTAISSPEGAFNSISTGTVQGTSYGVISTTAYITNGSSGGGLFDSKGQLIGIIDAYDTEKHYMSVPSNFIADISLNKSIPFSKWQYVSYQLVSPDQIEVTFDGDTCNVQWDSVLGADGYYVYYSTTPYGNYKMLKNSATNKFLWQWTYPNCFSIENLNQDIYIKVSTVMNGKESPTTKIYHILADK